MSAVRIVFPKMKLTRQLKAAGGLPVAEALAAADAKLQEIRPQCLSELQRLTEEAQSCFAAFPAVFDRDPLDRLYAIAVRAVGAGSVCGAPAADDAFVSLCTLVDSFATCGAWDLAAIDVHLKTAKLLVFGLAGTTDEAMLTSLLGGLAKVRARYALPKGAEPPPEELRRSA